MVYSKFLVMLGILVFSEIAKGEEPVSRTLDVKGVKIHYLLQGQGDVVVLIHGYHSSADINWKKTKVMEELAKKNTVLALDLPGHGKSESPEKAEAYGLQLVDDVIALLDHEKIKAAHIVGYSVGGMVAMKLAVTHADRVKSVFLGGMGWLKEGSPLEGLWGKMPAKGGSKTPTAFVQSVGKLSVTEEDVKKIKVPVMVLVGERDPVKKMYLQPLQKIRSDWPVVEVPEAGHLNCIVKPQFKNDIVRWITTQK